MMEFLIAAMALLGFLVIVGLFGSLAKAIEQHKQATQTELARIGSAILVATAEIKGEPKQDEPKKPATKGRSKS